MVREEEEDGLRGEEGVEVSSEAETGAPSAVT